jgi:CRISPR type IV-associated protein Csf2
MSSLDNKREVENLRIDGVLTLLSPLHISDPGEGWRYNPKSGYLIAGDSSIGYPATRTRALEFILEEMRDDDGILPVRIPVLPANGLRGRLRRCAAREVEDVLLLDHEERMSLNAYQALHCGAVSGTPRGDAADVATMRAMRSNVFVGLFGGGARMVPSRLRVSNGLAAVTGLVGLGAIPDGLVGDGIPTRSAFRLFHVVPLVRNDDAGTYRDARAEVVIRDYDQEMLRAFAEDTQRRQKRKSQAEEVDNGGDKLQRGVRAISAIETVAAGTPFYVRFDLPRATQAQAGLLLMALQRLVRQEDGGLGGKAATGYGAFGHRLYISVDSERAPLFDGQGLDTRVSESSQAIVGVLLEAADDELRKLRAADLDSLAMGDPPKAA